MKHVFVALLVAVFASAAVFACDHASASATSKTNCTKADASCCMHGAKADMTKAECPYAKKDACTATKAQMTDLKCQTCGEKATKKVKFAFEGTTYHFCCKDCEKEFKANPSKYISKDKS